MGTTKPSGKYDAALSMPGVEFMAGSGLEA